MENSQRQAAKRGAPMRAGRTAAMPGHSVPGPLFPKRAGGIGKCAGLDRPEGPGRCGMGAALRSARFLRQGQEDLPCRENGAGNMSEEGGGQRGAEGTLPGS